MNVTTGGPLTPGVITTPHCVPAFVDANGDVRDCEQKRKYARFTGEAIEFAHDKIKGAKVVLSLDIERMRLLLEMQKLSLVNRIMGG